MQTAVDVEPRDSQRAVHLVVLILDVLEGVEVAVLEHHLDQRSVDGEVHSAPELQARLVACELLRQSLGVAGHAKGPRGRAEPSRAGAAPPLVERVREALVRPRRLRRRRPGKDGGRGRRGRRRADGLRGPLHGGRRRRSGLVVPPIRGGGRRRRRLLGEGQAGLVHLRDDDVDHLRQGGKGIGQSLLHHAIEGTLRIIAEVVGSVEVEDELREVHFIGTSLRATWQLALAKARLAKDAIWASQGIRRLLTRCLLEDGAEACGEPRLLRAAADHWEARWDVDAVDLSTHQ
mmetsp:Transcript_165611/g.531570  ORF Transcript_165611/g.531570 Transcript_165611/m.531570 type:complete len:290 (-) Transcript_165611:3120-3989(-)